MIWLAWIGVATSIATLGLIIVGTAVATRRWGLNLKIETVPEFTHYPVSILKPLKGADTGLRENLESFFTLEYPQYELLFCVADDQDPAIPVVRELLAKYPKEDARLMIGEIKVGSNPKVNNMARAYDEAKYDLILISDSNVRVEKDDLAHWVSHYDDGVGVVTAIVTGVDPENMPGMLETIHLNTFNVRFMYVSDLMGVPAVVGKAMLMSRSKAAGFGGIRALANYLAEDYMTGVEFAKLGFRVVMSGRPARQYIGRHSYKTYWSRHVRWGRIRKASAPGHFWAEPLTGVLFVAVLLYVCLRAVASVAVANLGAAALIFIWVLNDLWMIRMIQGKITSRVFLTYIIRECLAPVLWAHAAIGSRVMWRGHKMKLQPGGILVE
jgi:ceramide glucosyltransferase